MGWEDQGGSRNIVIWIILHIIKQFNLSPPLPPSLSSQNKRKKKMIFVWFCSRNIGDEYELDLISSTGLTVNLSMSSLDYLIQVKTSSKAKLDISVDFQNFLNNQIIFRCCLFAHVWECEQYTVYNVYTVHCTHSHTCKQCTMCTLCTVYTPTRVHSVQCVHWAWFTLPHVYTVYNVYTVYCTHSHMCTQCTITVI